MRKQKPEQKSESAIPILHFLFGGGVFYLLFAVGYLIVYGVKRFARHTGHNDIGRRKPIFISTATTQENFSEKNQECTRLSEY